MEVMTREEVAALLKVPTSSLDRMRYAKKGPAFFRVHGKPRYNREEVEAWIKETSIGAKKVAP